MERETTYFFFVRKLADDTYNEIVASPVRRITPTAPPPGSNPGGGGGGSSKAEPPKEEDLPEEVESTDTVAPSSDVFSALNDISTNDWFYNDVNFAVENGLFKGVSNTEFAPNATMTRAMIITVLSRYAGVDIDGGEFWYSKSTAWGIENKITDGSDLDGNVSREQLAVLLWRFAGEPESDGDLNEFTDSGSVSAWAADAFNWANSIGLINGYPHGTLVPQGNATRAEVAAIIHRFTEYAKD